MSESPRLTHEILDDDGRSTRARMHVGNYVQDTHNNTSETVVKLTLATATASLSRDLRTTPANIKEAPAPPTIYVAIKRLTEGLLQSLGVYTCFCLMGTSYTRSSAVIAEV